MKAFITEIRMELESSLGYWVICTFVWQNLLSINAYYGKYATLMKLYKVQIWTMVHGLRTSRSGLTPQ